MLKPVTARIGANGSLTLPDAFMQRFGLDKGSIVTIEEIDDGLVVRSIESLIELYSPERKAEFLLSNTVDAEDYAVAADEVRRMGLDPDKILTE